MTAQDRALDAQTQRDLKTAEAEASKAEANREAAATSKKEAQTIQLNQATQLLDRLKNSTLSSVSNELGKTEIEDSYQIALNNAMDAIQGNRPVDYTPFRVDLKNILNRNSVNQALKRIPIGERNLSTIDNAVYGTGVNELSIDLREQAQKEIRKKIASDLLTNWNPQNSNVESVILGITNPDEKDQMLIDSLRSLGTERENAEVEILKKQFESGQLSDADFRAKFEGPNGNPSLKRALERYYNDPTKIEERKAQKDKEKEEKDKVTIKNSSTQYSNQLSGAGGFDEAGLDVDQVVNSISTAPGFGDLPTPVREAIMRHLELKGEGIKMDREIDVAKTAESKAKAQLETINVNKAAFSTFMKRFRWIALGAALGGLGGYFVPGITGVTGMLLGGAAGGTTGLILGNRYDKSIMEGVVATNAARQKHLESRKAISDVAAAKIKREVNATSAYTKAAALVQASVTGVDSEKMISAYLKSAGLKDIDAILAY